MSNSWLIEIYNNTGPIGGLYTVWKNFEKRNYQSED